MGAQVPQGHHGSPSVVQGSFTAQALGQDILDASQLQHRADRTAGNHPGTGVIAGGSIRTVLELAGIKNVLAQRLGSKTPLNNARAAMVALRDLRTHQDTAKERGITLEQIYS